MRVIDTARRGAGIVSLTVVAAVVSPAAASAAVVKLPGTVRDPVVMGGGLYYVGFARSGTVVRRLDLTSRRVSLAFRPPRWSNSVSELHAGAGTLAVGYWGEGRRSLRSEVWAGPATHGRGQVIAGGSEREIAPGEGTCGNSVWLQTVGAEGEVVTAEGTRSCSAPDAPGPLIYRAHQAGTSREIYREQSDDPAADAFASEADIRFADGRLLRWGNDAESIDTRSGAVTRIAVSGRRSAVFFADLGPGGDVVLNRVTLAGMRLVRTEVRLLPPGVRWTEGRTLFNSRRRYADMRFCGERILSATTTRGGLELRLRGGPVLGTVRIGRREIEEITCDAGHAAVVITSKDRDQARVRVFALH